MKKKDGDSAFPGIDYLGNRDSGMTLRDWFAGQALIGLTQNGYLGARPDLFQIWAEAAYEIADAMLDEREGSTAGHTA